jgi:peroxiredoxin
LLEEGMPLPDFDTTDDRGRRITRRDLLGKWAVVWWYLKADTPG